MSGGQPIPGTGWKKGPETYVSGHVACGPLCASFPELSVASELLEYVIMPVKNSGLAPPVPSFLSGSEPS